MKEEKEKGKGGFGSGREATRAFCTEQSRQDPPEKVVRGLPPFRTRKRSGRRGGHDYFSSHILQAFKKDSVLRGFVRRILCYEAFKKDSVLRGVCKQDSVLFRWGRRLGPSDAMFGGETVMQHRLQPGGVADSHRPGVREACEPSR